MPSAIPMHQPKWWKSAIVYQIYPASYCDSNGDGVGDIPGIISKLDYIKSTGVTCIWVSPFFKSPQYDLGYDISDYTEVHEPYGTVADVERLIAGCHERGLKIIFDLVINHTSHQHRWFEESRSSKDNPKRDWYIWRPARYIDGVRHPPCNWRGAFGGSVWDWDEKTQEYYLHLFTPEQPDLNWENAETRKAIYADAITFWLEKGCDGFRVDTVNMYSKHPLEDVPVTDPDTPWQPAGALFCNGPRLHEFLAEMHRETFSKYDCVTIGELPNTPKFEDILSYVSAARKELDLVIQFDLADLDHGRGRFTLLKQDWTLAQWKEITRKSQKIADPAFGDGWATTYLENHDQARSVSRYASDDEEHRVNASKMLATYLLTLSGTPIIYEGQEIGMKNAPADWDLSEFIDVGTVNCWAEIQQAAKEEGKPELLKLGEEGIRLTARDHARTPMQWDDSPHAGFTTAEAKPWMRVMDSYKEINAASQLSDKGQTSSPLAFYKSHIALRKAYPHLFTYGVYHPVDESDPHVMTFLKKGAEGGVAVVALNFSDEEREWSMPSEVVEGVKMKQVVDFMGGRKGALGAYEARVWVSEEA